MKSNTLNNFENVAQYVERVSQEHRELGSNTSCFIYSLYENENKFIDKNLIFINGHNPS